MIVGWLTVGCLGVDLAIELVDDEAVLRCLIRNGILGVPKIKERDQIEDHCCFDTYSLFICFQNFSAEEVRKARG